MALLQILSMSHDYNDVCSRQLLSYKTHLSSRNAAGADLYKLNIANLPPQRRHTTVTGLDEKNKNIHNRSTQMGHWEAQSLCDTHYPQGQQTFVQHNPRNTERPLTESQFTGTDLNLIFWTGLGWFWSKSTKLPSY